MYRNLLIAVAVFGLGWGASFGAGLAMGRRGAAPAVQAANAPGAQLAQGGQGALGGGQGGAGAQGRLGVVQSVDGKTLTVTGANNQPLKVALTDQTQILKQAAGAAADLTPGTRVAVQPQGQPAADGTVTAATVQVLPEGLAAALGQAAGQGAQGAQGGQRQAGGGQQGQQGQQGQGAQRQQQQAGGR
jgi:hypothetical protein